MSLLVYFHFQADALFTLSPLDKISILLMIHFLFCFNLQEIIIAILYIQSALLQAHELQGIISI